MTKKIYFLLITVVAGMMIISNVSAEIQNLVSFPHIINEASSETQIDFNWDEPDGHTPVDGYYVKLSTEYEPGFEFNEMNTLENPINTSSMRYQNLEDGSYYFYVAAYYFIDMEEVYDSTKMSGPYIVDTRPPLIDLTVPERTKSEVISILINATGANKMCISNLGFCNDNLIDIEESLQWQLLPGYGEKTIYAIFMDNAGNSVNTYATTFLDMSPPTATIYSSSSDITPVHITIRFNEAVSNFDLSDITVNNGNKVNFMPDETFPDTIFTFDIFPEKKGSVTIFIQPDSVVDSVGNGNKQIVYSFLFQVSYENISVPAMSKGGIILFALILIASCLAVMKNHMRMGRQVFVS
ncbi:MAG: hypothetical protein OMM_05521 [Candidatus Magnetoglobus multicellularis str. Araruama]|uniref:Bacterial Ig-like domain-containing protein n=1 Tax=Candidatus Magnetoglobus multicellularis str. Araruama TaxID=890399 RepID=A0A1V1NVX7_9BACT|nr:MAG: hypothetical protein OMM_05521 [Candidatus Magnetoglobus multicellularis str. Araruama]